MQLSKALIFLLFSAIITVYSLEIPIFVSEPGVVDRVGEGISCGIPFKKGDISTVSQISLYEGSTELPAQFDVLTRHNDGTPMWVLASFRAHAVKNGKKEYKVVTQAPSISATEAITIRRSGSSIEVNNGVVRFKIDTANFSGIDSLFYNNEPYFGGKTGGIILDNVKDSVQYKNGKVTKAEVIYSGPVRFTIKVDGVFFRKSAGGLAYSYVVTTYAGSNSIAIDATVKNSISETTGDIARIGRATVAFPLLFSPTSENSFKFNASQYAKPEIKNFSAGGKSITIQEEWNGGVYGYVEVATGSNFMFHNISTANGLLSADIIVTRPSDVPSPSKSRGYESGAWYWLPDGQCKSSQITLRFDTVAKNSTDLSSEYMLNKSPLFGRPDPKRISETGLLGIYGSIGTIEDEVTTWNNFGKTTSGVAKPFVARDLQFTKALCIGTLHYDLEDDPLEQWLLQWIRTDSRGFMDRTVGWMRYMKNTMTYHTTGFEYDGFGHNKQKIRNLSKRTISYLADDFADAKKRYNSTIDFDTWGSCHTIGWGLISWYCLTGDIEAREAADELAEVTWPSSWYYASLLPGAPQSPKGTYNAPFYSGKGFVAITRDVTRPYHFLMNYYSRLKQGDNLWKNRIDLTSEMFFNVWNRDPRGFYYTFNPMMSMNGDTNYYFLSSRRKTWAGWTDRLRALITDSQVTFKSEYLPKNKFEGNAYSNKIVMASVPIQGGDTLKWVQKSEATAWSSSLFCYHPFAEYYRLTGNEDARDYIIGCAEAMVKSPLILSRCGISHNGNAVDYPLVGHANCNAGHSDLAGGDSANPVGFDNLNSEHDKCVNSWGVTAHSCAIHDGAYTCQISRVMAMAFGYTGDRQFIEKAFTSWNRGIKRPFLSSAYTAPENNMAFGFVTGENNGDNRFVGGLNLFYEAVYHTDTNRPAKINDLEIAPSLDHTGKVFVKFTMPSAGSGSLSEYQLKFDTVPVVSYESFNYKGDYIFPAGGVKRIPFWCAKNIPDEPRPGGDAGTIVMFEINGSFLDSLGSDTLHFALCTRNSNGNMSAVSNSAKIWIGKQGIAAEKGKSHSLVNNIRISPNPFNPVTAIEYRIIGGEKVFLEVLDARGRKVADLSKELKNVNSSGQSVGTILWNGHDINGKVLPSAIYIVRMISGKHVITKRVTMLK
ncbi:MAG: T9SS type A sorting domain-containing protein [Fibrobacteres bacterium]|nr:T9SS type A sorting domain-containing protein [Fibrobacterota bacterium]